MVSLQNQKRDTLKKTHPYGCVAKIENAVGGIQKKETLVRRNQMLPTSASAAPPRRFQLFGTDTGQNYASTAPQKLQCFSAKVVDEVRESSAEK